MEHSEETGERRVRRRRTISEKRRIVAETLEAGASVALVARAHGVNANQVFKWRRDFERGELAESSASPTGLLPVTVSGSGEMEGPALGVKRSLTSPASIHIEFPGRALVSVEGGADAVLLRVILESFGK